MNALERRALYNLLRMNWLNEPTLAVEPWQVEDYRSLPLTALFQRLEELKIHLDRQSFMTYADECDSPEDLTDHLTADRNFSTTEEDKIYLVLFELWRRIMSEKPSLSIICNELDYQIYLYDHQQLENPLALQDALTHFVHILDENADQGIPPQEVLKLISIYCANDIEAFLFDFISEQIDEESEAYAQDLFDDVETYVGNNKWFKLLRLRLSEHIQSKIAQKLIEEIIEEHLSDQDLDYNFEFLSLLMEKGNYPMFRSIVKQTLSLLKNEEDFQDLVSIAIDYYHLLDEDRQAKNLNAILEKRAAFPKDQPLHPRDEDLAAFTELFNSTMLSHRNLKLQ